MNHSTKKSRVKPCEYRFANLAEMTVISLGRAARALDLPPAQVKRLSDAGKLPQLYLLANKQTFVFDLAEFQQVLGK